MRKKCSCTTPSSPFSESFSRIFLCIVVVVPFAFLDSMVIFLLSLFLPVAADIPVDRAARLWVELLEDQIAVAIDSADKLKGLFGKAKVALAKLYHQISPKLP